MKNLLKLLVVVFSATFMLSSCSNDDDNSSQAAVLETYNLDLSAQAAIPGMDGRTETGTAVIQILSNNTLSFALTVNNLSSTDNLTVAHIHTGDVVTAGGVLVGLVNGEDIQFNGNTASGVVDVTAEQIEAIAAGNVYVNVHSEEVPSGLVRGDFGVELNFAKNVTLLPENEVPAVTGRSETGMAYVRVDSNNRLHYKVIVNDLAASDAIVASHIHQGSATENGDVIVALDVAELDVTKTLDLTADQLTAITQNASYINVHSTEQPAGLLRGQVTE